MKLRTLIFAGISSLFAITGAQAATLDLDDAACPDSSIYIATTDVTGNTGGSDACFGAYNGNDNDYDAYETDGVIFELISKSDMGAGSPTVSGDYDIGLTVTFGDDCGTSATPTTTGADDNGCWAFTGLSTGYADFMVVIKAASSPGWAAYLFSTNNGSTSGTWQVSWAGGNAISANPCVNSTGFTSTADCAKISHLAIYAAKGDTTKVAEPGTLALLGLGLLGLGFARRRRTDG